MLNQSPGTVCHVPGGSNLSVMGSKGKAFLAGGDTWLNWRYANCDCLHCSVEKLALIGLLAGQGRIKTNPVGVLTKPTPRYTLPEGSTIERVAR